MESDLINRQAAIDALGEEPPIWYDGEDEIAERNQWRRDVTAIKELPSAQPEPSEITDEQAILHLQSTGWMQRHDKEMYESGLREQLADDSGSYDSLIPCEDTISRQAAIQWVKTECNPYGKPTLDFESGKKVIEHLKQMPSARPERKKGSDNGGKTAMTKYSDIEIQTAKNLLKEGYKWLYRSSFGTLYAYETKPLMKEANFDGYGLLCKSYVPIFQSVKSRDEPVSLESIVHQQILDDTEKRYLSAVIRPFRDSVKFICKVSVIEGSFQRIVIGITGVADIILPDFKSGTMYKGMKPGHAYKLEELGI